MVYNKHFTVEEARLLLPHLKEKLQDIRDRALRLEDIGFDIYIGKYKSGFHPGTLDEFPEEYSQIRDMVADIFMLGIEIKGLEQGIIDFPAVRDNGEEVFLCWKLDEEDIEFWHSLSGGFKGRRPIDEF